MENLTENEKMRYERAAKSVKAISGFYKHLTVYILVNLFLIGTKYFTMDPGDKFLEFNTFSTAFFWGIGLAFHAVGAFGKNVYFGRDWEERKIKEIMEKNKNKGKWE